MSAVVRRGSAHLDSELDAGTARQLVRVHSKAEAVGEPRVQDLPSRIKTEGAALTKDVAPPGLRRTGVKHRSGHERDVFLLLAPEFRRHHVRAEKGDLFRDRLGNL